MQENRYTIPYWKTLKPNTSAVLNTGRSCAMENEIFQQENLLLHLKNNVPPFSATIEKIFLFGCGSSYNAALLGKYYIEQIAGIPTEIEYASELVYRPMLQPKNTLFVGISQSGETADTLRAMELLFDKQKVIGITNNKDSRAYNNFPCLLLEAGQEIGVAATKTFTLTCTTLLQLALRLAEVQGMHIIGPDLQLLHYYVGEILNSDNQLAKLMEISTQISKYRHALYLARSQNYPIALEGALKLKEVSYIHAEAMPAAEMKHGPIALIDDDTISIFIITNQRDNLQAKVINNMQEIKARGGKIIAITDPLTTSSVWKIADSYFCIPKCHEYLQPIVANIALQLIAYYTATILGRNVDRPRSLAKSVTVE
jgi:glucosamine--fructose-6-phosphate aminotransferase (isomerizing)